MTISINQKIGASMLLAGTAIGAGMLGMPFVSGICGYFPTICVMIICFLIMLANLFLLLEATLYCSQPNVNIIGMAREHLPPIWSAICWVTFMLLLYSIIASYMNAGGDLMSFFLSQSLQPISKTQGILLFSSIFSLIVMMGAVFIDHINRIFMVILLVTFFIVAISLNQLFEINHLMTQHHYEYMPYSLPIITAAFTSHLILPSLKSYIPDLDALKKVLFYGSLIPLILYLIWQTTVLGIVEPKGPLSIFEISKSAQPITQFFKILESKNALARTEVITQLFFFSAIATSFLGVLMSLNDFLADGLGLKQHKLSVRIRLILLASIPPLIFTLYFNNAFTYALNFAALFIAILYAIIPSLVVIKCRHHQMTSPYILPGGNMMVYIIFIFGCLFALLSLLSVYDLLPRIS